VLFAACKKADFAQKSSLQNEERFFKLPANARPELKRIVEDLKIKNKIHPFINEFIASEGYPLWEFAQFKKRKFNVTNRGDGNEQDSLVQVPIVQEEAQYVKDILNIRIDSSILYKLIAGEEYASFGFNKDPNRTTPNANDIVGTIMAYEHLIWGQNIFEITDNRLFDNWPQGAPKPDSFYVVQKFTTTYSTITWVCGFHTGGQLQSCPPGVEHCFELIPEICSITWVSTTYEGDGDSGEWVPIPPTITPGSSSGSGTGTNPTTTNPPNNLPTICGSGRGWVRIVPDIESGIWKNPCTGIPVPIEGEPGGRDANGYLYSRIAELQQILLNFPQALLPCDSLNIMPLEQYGSMWQNVAQFKPSQYVMNRIDSIRNVAPNWIVDNFYIQSLEDAYGGIVNCDFFPVRITQIPAGFTPESLLEYFRTRINSFIDPNLGMSFGPYWDYGAGAGLFIDTAKYLAPYEASVGSLWHLDLGPLPGADGSVIESGYMRYNSGGYQSNYFTVSTMETPLDFEHPVGGNRRFGIYSDPDHPGEFVFYTMGVDRAWDWVFDVGNKPLRGFESADSLWTSLQNGMVNFIGDHGGVSSFYSNHNTIARPKWNDVEDYLMGTINFIELKTRLGC